MSGNGSGASKPVHSGPGLIWPLGLALLVLISAILVVQCKHQTRVLHHDSNRLTAEREQLDVEWAQLQLEEAAHSNHARIESKARRQLLMIEPQQPININAVGSSNSTAEAAP